MQSNTIYKIYNELEISSRKTVSIYISSAKNSQKISFVLHINKCVLISPNNHELSPVPGPLMGTIASLWLGVSENPRITSSMDTTAKVSSTEIRSASHQSASLHRETLMNIYVTLNGYILSHFPEVEFIWKPVEH